MRVVRSHRGGLRGAAVAAAAVAAVLPGGASVAAAAAPPPVSNIRATVTDHQAVVTFDVPAAYYDPGAHGIGRLTIGRTPAASPTSSGYAVRLSGRTVTTYYLNAAYAYTLAIWVEDGGLLSARRSVTFTTPADVTPPHPLARVTAEPGLLDGCVPTVTLRFTPSVADIDIATLRIVRNTVYTTTGGDRFAASPWGWQPRVDAGGLARHTRYYYWVIPYDTTGHPAPYYVGVSVVTR